MEQTFRFRLRFRVAKPLASPAQELELKHFPLKQPVRLLAATRGTVIKAADWLVASSQGYSSDAEACHSGQLLQDALLLSGAQCVIGVDVGQDDRATTRLAQAVKDAVFRETGTRCRDNVFGLDVFEDVDTVVFGINAELRVSGNPDTFTNSVMELASLVPFMDKRSRTSAKLINDALFLATPETHLLMLMTAIESLWPSPKRSEAVCALTDALLLHLDTLNGSEADKDDVRRRVNDIKTNSISTLCSNNICRLLGSDRAQEFKDLYQARSRFTHHGKGRASLDTESHLALRLAIDVLLAELRDRAGKRGEKST